ncbi:hypothetical protein CK215_27555 [Mesorhizobium sp. WSM3864]|nr:hypothetical protein CK215_27555 [Mesorhizobium sp. WSM3864]
MSRGKRLISPLEGEMSPQATEGGAAREAPCWRATREDVGARRETTPSALPGISPARGEISCFDALPLSSQAPFPSP